MIGVKKKEDIFFDLFINAMDEIKEAGVIFECIINNYTEIAVKADQMKAYEVACDKNTHQILKVLNESFITPFDREDIYTIAKELDNIVDVMEKVVSRFLVFNVQAMRPEAVALTRLITLSIQELSVLINALKTIKKSQDLIKKQIIEVNRLENEGDTLYRQVLTDLFATEKDPIELLKWQQIYELLEDCLDACEEVANTIEGVVIKDA